MRGGGGGFQLIDRRDTSTARLGPFGAQIAARLETHKAEAVLVRAARDDQRRLRNR